MNEIATPATPDSSRITYTNERAKFRWLAMRGALLELITFGFYRFWLVTDLRRHLWARTSVNGDAVEYTGRGKELLLGFLFAIAILAPVYLAYFLIGLEVERWKVFASIPLFVFFYLFTQFAVYRARRYRLTRTVWRGVRFWMTGSGWSYAWRASLWSLLVIVTLGLALPWKEAALECYKIRHTSYGDLAGRFEGTGWGLFKRVWWMWLLVALVIVVVGLGASLIEASKGAPSKEAMDTPLAIAGGGLLILSEILLLVGYPFVYAIFKAIEWRWWVSGLRFGDVSFSSDLKRRAFFGLYWKVIGWNVLFLGVLSAIVAAFILPIVIGLAHLSEQDFEAVFGTQLLLLRPLSLAAIIVSYIVTVLALGVVIRVYLMHDMWKRVIDSVAVHNLAAANNVAAKGKLAGSLGEGLADGLGMDVAGF